MTADSKPLNIVSNFLDMCEPSKRPNKSRRAGRQEEAGDDVDGEEVASSHVEGMVAALDEVVEETVTASA